MSAEKTGFFEIVLEAADFAAAGFSGRDEIEEPIQELLKEGQLGEVSGGGTGSGVLVIDVDVFDEAETDRAITLVAERLRSLNVPRGTNIECRVPERKTIPVWPPAS